MDKRLSIENADDDQEPAPYVCGLCRQGNWILMNNGACVCTSCNAEAESLECMIVSPDESIPAVDPDGLKVGEALPVNFTPQAHHGSAVLMEPGTCGKCGSPRFVLWQTGHLSCYECGTAAQRQRHYTEQA